MIYRERARNRMLPATALAAVAVAVTGCGGGAKKPPPPAPTPAQIERTAAAERRLHIDESVGEYVSELVDSPSTANDPRVAAVTLGQLNTEITTAPPECAKALQKIIATIVRKDLKGPSKSSRVKRQLTSADGRC